MGRNSFRTEEKVRLVLDGMRCPGKITEICRQVGISRSTYYQWQKSLLQKGREGLADSRNGKVDPEKARLVVENQRLKELVANLSVENLTLKKSLMGE